MFQITKQFMVYRPKKLRILRSLEFDVRKNYVYGGCDITMFMDVPHKLVYTKTATFSKLIFIRIQLVWCLIIAKNGCLFILLPPNMVILQLLIHSRDDHPSILETTKLTGNGKFIPPTKIVIFLGDGGFMTLF